MFLVGSVGDDGCISKSLNPAPTFSERSEESTNKGRDVQACATVGGPFRGGRRAVW
ncbi:hypothetical protein GCM10027567_16590 [Spongiibacter taiwanensis]